MTTLAFCCGLFVGLVACVVVAVFAHRRALAAQERAGENLSGLTESFENQRSFAAATRDLIASLDMADELGRDPGEDEDEPSAQDSADSSDEEGEGDEGAEGTSQAQAEVTEGAAPDSAGAR